MKRSYVILMSIILLLLIIFTPIIVSSVQEKQYYKNNIVSYTGFADITILEKYVEKDKNYLKLTLDSKYYIDRYNIKDNVRVFEVPSKELFDSINPNKPKNYIGITIQATVSKNDILEEEFNWLKSDPFAIIAKEEYSKYIKVVGISKTESN
ncbi:hypothetical protein [Paenibacillus tuaregi]|uniref:hypothetical protein n=1 Tax=Paenibacillus tuaregi TaxID=1816681 RepID=UPI00083859CA|nr:hypothetical protein [Paenibacillus tuaregi]